MSLRSSPGLCECSRGSCGGREGWCWCWCSLASKAAVRPVQSQAERLSPLFPSPHTRGPLHALQRSVPSPPPPSRANWRAAVAMATARRQAAAVREGECDEPVPLFTCLQSGAPTAGEAGSDLIIPPAHAPPPVTMAHNASLSNGAGDTVTLGFWKNTLLSWNSLTCQ